MPTRLTFNAGVQDHFGALLLPLYLDLPEEYRGTFYARGQANKRARDAGVQAVSSRLRERKAPVVVASHEDYRSSRPAPIVMVNHGCGQTYHAIDSELGYRHPSYSGGTDRDRIVLNLCPSERDAALNRKWWPDAKSVACGPWRLDPFFRGDRGQADEELIVFSFHADVAIAPETRWAFGHYRDAIKSIAKSGKFNLAGHGHPRVQHQLAPFWRECGIPFIRDLDEVLDRASLYVIDNSSSAMEAAALDIPVLTLNAPGYRRHVEHGLRFWSAIPGLAIDNPEDLQRGITLALENSEVLATKRWKAVAEVYDGDVLNGHATERAVNTLIELAECW